MRRAGSSLGRTVSRSALFASLLASSAVGVVSGLHCGPGRFEGVTGARATDAGRDAPDTGTPPTETPESQCIEACVKKHPNGVPNDEAVEGCINQNCPATCGTGDSTKAAEELDGSAGATCPAEVVTDDENCDQCVRAHCCTPWTICYADAGFGAPPSECELLDQCYEDCLE